MTPLALLPNLPERDGPRPATDKRPPHTQLEQLASPADRQRLSEELVSGLTSLADIQPGLSRRAPPGSVGFYLDPAKAVPTPRCFMLDTEIAHVHSRDDGSLHAILPEPVRTQAIEAGWAEPHPFAGQPTISPDIVMIYAPRNEAELATIVSLVSVGYANARRAP